MNRFNDYLSLIKSSLMEYLPHKSDDLLEPIYNAMSYSLSSGGKRIRPVLLLEFCRVCGGDIYKAMPFACSVEMIHTYSLIHDDLPCMDNDDIRRGKPANHIMYGDAVALLAGDALLTRAFEIMLESKTLNNVGVKSAADAAFCLAHNIGVGGMIGGQVIDMGCEGKNVDSSVLVRMHSLKTGALITAAAEIGCIIAGADEFKINAAREYARSIGLAFQIVDDILDATSTTEKSGKNAGSDKIKNKATYASVLGIHKSRQIVAELTDKAINSLDIFDGNTDFLKDLALSLSKRNR